MVDRKFIVRYNDDHFVVNYNTDHGIEVLKHQLFSLTSLLPDHQKIIGSGNVIIDDGTDLNLISDEVRLVSVIEEGDGDGNVVVSKSEVEVVEDEVKLMKVSGEGGTSSGEMLKVEESAFAASEELARNLQAEEEALFFQQYRASDKREEFEKRVQPYISQVLMYEDPIRQEAARKSVPVEELEEKALVSLAKEGKFKPSEDEKNHAFLLQLLFWFKQSFRWVDSPPCDNCGSSTKNCGMGVPHQHEIQFGGSRVELYRCNNCSGVTRFPRYNDPLKLVETKRGRCGEWANCFTLYCRAFQYKSRLILDFTDHVWTECFSNSLGRWMHLDPCEGIYDNPLLYESGWKKNLNYVIAFGKDGVRDVTKRYTKKWHEVLTRRNITTESVVSIVLSDLTEELRRGFTSLELSVLLANDKNETEELERDLYSQINTSIFLPGRLSGSKEWRLARSEMGINDNDSLSCLLCPVRLCVDAHVSSIYNAFYPLLLHLNDNGLSNLETVETLEAVKMLLTNVNRKPFKARRIAISPDSNFSIILQRCKPAISGLLAALSLKMELDTEGRMSICLAGDPVQTSISLPVVLDALGDMVDTLKSLGKLIKDSLSPPLLKCNRISSGLVLASGEEFPFGIVTCAFDGTRQSKWEEPNGSKGCWVIYKVREGQMFELEAYELMSANDAPERDPMNWIVEGSYDGGLSWHVLDRQISQIFEKRFQRKWFKIDSVQQLSNIFRLTFHSVRDVHATSRLQLGSIELYAKPT